MDYLIAVSAAASAFVAFLGGFFVVRLQTYSQEWTELRLDLHATDRRTKVVREDLRRLADDPAHERDELAGEMEVAELLRTLAVLHARRDEAHFPQEILFQFGMLVALTACCVIWPIALLPAPSGGMKIWFLSALVVLILVLWVGMLLIARHSLSRLKNERPDPLL